MSGLLLAILGEAHPAWLALDANLALAKGTAEDNLKQFVLLHPVQIKAGGLSWVLNRHLAIERPITLNRLSFRAD